MSIPNSSLSEEAPVLKISAPVSPSGASVQEGLLVSQVYAAAIKAAGIQAVVEPAQATAKDQISSLETGGSDIAPAYSRELLASLAPSAAAESAADVVNALKKALPEGISMLDAAKAQDSDNLVVTAATAEKYQLKSIEDLAKVCNTLVLVVRPLSSPAAEGLLGWAVTTTVCRRSMWPWNRCLTAVKRMSCGRSCVMRFKLPTSTVQLPRSSIMRWCR
ncbi:glycine betaine ABC transporter substrate-binding protein [Arthrobacter alpinus]|nr:glycine betaine ABC transporter substrate-binding protein [Arthrobacter alpinus]